MLSRVLALLCLASILAVAACNEGPPTAGTPRDFATVCDKANDGKRVSLDGYLRLPDSFHGDSSVALRLYQGSKFTGTPVGVTMEFGSEPNHLDAIQDQYKDTDLRVHVANGQTVTYGSKVRVSGTVYFPVSGISTADFDCGLSNPLVESLS